MSQRHPIQSDATMLITIVTRNRYPYFSEPAYAREAIETLYRIQGNHPFFLYGFVFMSDHCHLLLKVPAPGTVSKMINVYKSGLAFNIGVYGIWQSRFHVRIPKNPSSALRYIHHNPVKANLCETPEKYPWSSVSGKWDISPLDA